MFFYTDDITAAGNMKDVPEFKEWLGQTFGDPSLWESLILPAMKHIIVCTTKCVNVSVCLYLHTSALEMFFPYVLTERLNSTCVHEAVSLNCVHLPLLST